MIMSGKECDVQISREEVANLTVKCLSMNVPKEVEGIVFLSGGQSDEDATAHLNLMNSMDIEHPWQLSYSYGRAFLRMPYGPGLEGSLRIVRMPCPPSGNE